MQSPSTTPHSPNFTSSSEPSRCVPFLDIDGVISPFTKQFSGHATDPIKFISLDCLAVLNEWLDGNPDFAANIVLSSSWRNNPGFDKTVEVLTKVGLRGKIVAATPYWETIKAPTAWSSGYKREECLRSDAIWQYLDNLETKPEHVVILDDIAEMKPLGRYHLLTSPYAGIKRKQLRRLTEISRIKYQHNPSHVVKHVL
jgi:hypothetical protein